MNPWGKNSYKKRDTLLIIAEILETARKRASKTHIMYNANLSFATTNEYLMFMLKNTLLEKSIQNNKKIYKTTEKGIDFLQRFYEITELLKTEDDKQNDVKIPPLQLLKITY